MDGGAVLPGKPVPHLKTAEDGGHRLHLMVEGLRCGGCVAKLERAVAGLGPEVSARVNLTTRRLVVGWQGDPGLAGRVLDTVEATGFKAAPFDPDLLARADDADQRRLLVSLGVAGFGAANVMLLSLAVWFGHAQGMEPATRDMLHWFSALIALPVVAFAGMPFYAPAWSAMRQGRTNMEVPIALAVLLTPVVSLQQILAGAEHAYFDSAVTLLFFLLLGRTLDKLARGRARQQAERLLSLQTGQVTVLDADGATRAVATDGIRPGMRLLLATGERIGADGLLDGPATELDTAALTGESVGRPAAPGEPVFAGMINQGPATVVTVTKAGDDTLLADILRMMEAAEQRRSRYVAIADRISAAYAPFVNIAAVGTFLFWVTLGGADWATALITAIAVLIITCPCALGLAVPAVQVIAVGRLMRAGVLLKSGTALERLNAVDTVVFDKTGTLTLGRPRLVPGQPVAEADLDLASGLAAASRHPLSRALRAARPDAPAAPDVTEHPGQGLSAPDGQGGEIRLGNRGFCAIADGPADGAMELWLARPGRDPLRLTFDDPPRADATHTVAAFKRLGLEVRMLSGDRAPVAEATARALGIEHWRAETSPAGKVQALEALRDQGRRVLMVGDGLNDAPALAAAHVSLSPAEASDITQNTADAVFGGARLGPVLLAVRTARAAQRLVGQNFAMSLIYNIVLVPVAMLGYVTPLVAAIAMSSSSILVVANSMRLSRP